MCYVHNLAVYLWYKRRVESVHLLRTWMYCNKTAHSTLSLSRPGLFHQQDSLKSNSMVLNLFPPHDRRLMTSLPLGRHDAVAENVCYLLLIASAGRNSGDLDILKIVFDVSRYSKWFLKVYKCDICIIQCYRTLGFLLLVFISDFHILLYRDLCLHLSSDARPLTSDCQAAFIWLFSV